MWKVIQEILPILLIILVISQYVIPVLMKSKTWWLFRPSDKPEVTKTDKPSDLTSELEETKKVVDQAKDKVGKVKEKVAEHFKSAEDLKKESDNLLK